MGTFSGRANPKQARISWYVRVLSEFNYLDAQIDVALEEFQKLKMYFAHYGEKRHIFSLVART